MIDVGYKFKSTTGINVTVIKKYNNWGTYIVQIRKIDDRGRVINEGVKFATTEEIKNKTVDFEEDYIKKYADMMKEEVKKKGR